jgi:hypothetical protein
VRFRKHIVSSGAPTFASERPFFLGFKNRPRQMAVLATHCWRHRFNWRSGGLAGDDPILFGGSRSIRIEGADRFSM